MMNSQDSFHGCQGVRTIQCIIKTQTGLVLQEFLVQVTVSYPAIQLHAQICVPAQKHEDSSVNTSVNLSYSKLEPYLCDILQNTSVFIAINVARVKKNLSMLPLLRLLG